MFGQVSQGAFLSVRERSRLVCRFAPMAWYCPTGTADGSQPSRRQRLRRLLRVWALVALIWYASTKATGLTLKLSAGDTRRAAQPAVHRSLTSCRRPINGDERDATAQPQVPSQTGSTATTRRSAAVAGRLRSPPQHVPPTLTGAQDHPVPLQASLGVSEPQTARSAPHHPAVGHGS